MSQHALTNEPKAFLIVHAPTDVMAFSLLVVRNLNVPNAKAMDAFLATVRRNYFVTIAKEHATLFLNAQGGLQGKMNDRLKLNLQDKARLPFKLKPDHHKM